jgi:hypothetical protein
VGGVFGYGKLGIGEAVQSFGLQRWSNCRHGEEATNTLCPMPHAAGRLSLTTQKGMEFPRRFQLKTHNPYCGNNKGYMGDDC